MPGLTLTEKRMRLPLITCLFTAFATTALAAPVQWSTVSGGNDHYYELITAPLDWVSARSDATSRQHAGFQGYLTSITSQAEQNFVLNVIAGQPAVWTGGADLFNEGTWTWHDGPEHGTIFHQNGVNIGYNAFIGSEPNGGTGENALETGFFGSFWNDGCGPAAVRRVRLAWSAETAAIQLSLPP